MVNEIKKEIVSYIKSLNDGVNSNMLAASVLLSEGTPEERMSEKNLQRLKQCVRPALSFSNKIEASCVIFDRVSFIEKYHHDEEN